MIKLWTTSLDPFGSVDTRSHTSMMAPQSSVVRVASVALAAIDNPQLAEMSAMVSEPAMVCTYR